MPLELERKFYNANKAKMLRLHRGKYVLIKGAKVAGVYSDAASAYRAGVEKFGTGQFLVTQVTDRNSVTFSPMISRRARVA